MNIALGIPEAIKVSRLCKDDALDIPINKPPGVQKASKLLFAGRPGNEFTLGSMEFTLIGPTAGRTEEATDRVEQLAA